MSLLFHFRHNSLPPPDFHQAAKKTPAPPPLPPPSATAKRVLIQSQKGDWPACEQSLKALEREAFDGGDKRPLANVSDAVTGNTPLMYAAMENKLSMVDRMLDLGCDINAKNKVIPPPKKEAKKST